MYKFLTLLCGSILAISVTINGMLSNSLGLYLATVIIHIVGIIFAFLILLFIRQKITLKKDTSWWLYSAGAIGVGTVIFNNFSFGKIPITSIITLGLFAQLITSLIIDEFGLLGMKKYSINRVSLIGILFSIAGIWLMLDLKNLNAITAIIFSLLAGFFTVITRTINAKLALIIGDVQGSLVNHIVGFVFSIPVLLILGRESLTNIQINTNPIIYIGGMCGVIVVLLFNIAVPKLSSFYITIFSFIGQVFTSLAIDILILSQDYDTKQLIGSIVVSIGILITNLLEHKLNKQIA